VKAKARERLLADEAVMAFGLPRAKDPQRTVAEVAAIAFLQVGDLYDAEGRLLPVKDLPPHVQAAIGNPETVTGNVDKADGHSDRIVRVRQWDKPKMLELLAKFHGLADERMQVKGDINFRWAGDRDG